MNDMNFYITDNGIMIFIVNSEIERYAVTKWLLANIGSDYVNLTEIKYKK